MAGYVYKIYIDNELAYIGSTSNFAVRMWSHTSKREECSSIPIKERKRITKIEYVETETVSNARVLETYLIAQYKPRINREFCEEDELTYKFDFGKLEWREYDFRNIDDTTQSIRIKQGKELLYEIPKVQETYERLQAMLGLKTSFEKIPYSFPVEDGAYVIT